MRAVAAGALLATAVLLVDRGPGNPFGALVGGALLLVAVRDVLGFALLLAGIR